MTAGGTGVSPVEEGQTVPSGLAAVLRRLLAVDKAQRYATPAEAAEALRPFCAGADLAALFVRVGDADSGHRATPRPTQGSNRVTQRKPPTASFKGETTSSVASAPVEGAQGRRISRKMAVALPLIAVAVSLLLGVYVWRIAPVPPATAELSPPQDAAVDWDAERRAAEWVLASGGTINVLFSGKDEAQPLKQPLQDVPFRVVNINLHGIRKVSDEGLACLAPLTNLRVLDLYHTKITDASLEWVGRQRHLQRLSIHDTAITDAGLRHLGKLEDLTALNLSKTQVSDQGLVHLTGLKKLVWLQLRNTAVTDEGVQHLRQLTALQDVYLDPVKVSKKATEDLKASLPDCNINPDLR